MKKCSNCKQEKSVLEFNKKGLGLQPWCKECNKIRSRLYYAQNRDNHLIVIKARKNKVYKEHIKRIKAIKSNSCCSLCPESESLCLDFHHLGTKDVLISRVVHQGYSWGRILLEMKKCVILCSNCHRKVHGGILSVTKDMLWCGVNK